MASTRGKKGGNKLWNWIWDKQGNELNSPPSARKNSGFDFNMEGRVSSSLPTSPKGGKTLRESSENNISKAKQVISEIENIIQRELSMMADDSFISTNKEIGSPGFKRRKQKGPKLIRPLNKKKNRMVIGEMTFDPIRNVWDGNETDLNAFQRPQPALIANMGKNQPQVVGEMVFDPIEQRWKGNEKELSKFGNVSRPALISQMNPSNEIIEKDGMVFDPELMIWRGNDDVLDAFDKMEFEEEKNAFKVGQEFSLSPEVKDLFLQCQDKHSLALRGWVGSDADRTGRQFQHFIRSMSITRIINQAKRGVPASNLPSANQKSASSTASALSPRLNTHTVTTATGATANIRLKSPTISSDDDWDGDFSADENFKTKFMKKATNNESDFGSDALEDMNVDQGEEAPRPKLQLILPTSMAPKASNPALSAFQEREDDDMGFDDEAPTIKSTPLQTNTVSPKSSHRNSIGSLSEDNSNIGAGRASLDSDEERVDDDEDASEWDGLEIPDKLNLNSPGKRRVGDDDAQRERGDASHEDESFWDSEGENRDTSFSPRDSTEVTVEDWPDVEIPRDGKLVLKRDKSTNSITKLARNEAWGTRSKGTGGRASEDELSGLEIPTSGFALSRKHTKGQKMPSSASEGEESEKEPKETFEDWEADVEFGEDFATKLKAKSSTSSRSSHNNFGQHQHSSSRHTNLY